MKTGTLFFVESGGACDDNATLTRLSRVYGYSTRLDDSRDARENGRTVLPAMRLDGKLFNEISEC